MIIMVIGMVNNKPTNAITVLPPIKKPEPITAGEKLVPKPKNPLSNLTIL